MKESVEEQVAQETERRSRLETQKSRGERRSRQLHAFCLVGIVVCLLIVLSQFTSLSPWGFPRLRQRPVRVGLAETDPSTDPCIANLWQIARTLQGGREPDASLVCPSSGKSYRVSREGEETVARCPTPGRHACSEIRVSKHSPIPEVIR